MTFIRREAILQHWREKVNTRHDEFRANRRTFLLLNSGGGFVQTEQKVFKLHAPYQPTGDQPQAIEALVKGFEEGN